MSYRPDLTLLDAADLQATRPWSKQLAVVLAVVILGVGYLLLHEHLKPPASGKKGKAKAAAPANPGDH